MNKCVKFLVLAGVALATGCQEPTGGEDNSTQNNLPTDSALASLSFDGLTMIPTFDPGTMNYSGGQAAYTLSQVTIHAAPHDPLATFAYSVGGQKLVQMQADTPVTVTSLNHGGNYNSITVYVYSQAGGYGNTTVDSKRGAFYSVYSISFQNY